MTDISQTEVAEVNEAEAEGGKRKLGKPVIIGIGALALVLAAGAGAFFLTQSGGGNAEVAPIAANLPEPYFYDLPEMTVNLNTGGGAAEFLKLSIALELSEESMLDIVEPRMPRVLDAFQVYLRELRRADLEGSAGIYRLKEELQRRINLAVYPATVDNILFKEILIE